MSKLQLTIGCRAYDRVSALADGRIGIEGCDVNFVSLPAEELFHRAYGRAEFDVTELSMSSHIVTTDLGISLYAGLPIFVSRMFRHAAIYIRTDRGIELPSDLRGKTIGVPEYQMTAALWARGMLADVYGVNAKNASWRTGGLEQPGRKEKFGLTFPGFDVQPIGDTSTLNDLLSAGLLDGLISARAPSCFAPVSGSIARLFPDSAKSEREYFSQTRLFPIMHLIGIRRDLVDRYPWLPTSVYKAFDLAKRLCFDATDDDNALQVVLPWLLQEVKETRDLMGKDYWPYGVRSNTFALEAMVRYAHEQGLTAKPVPIEKLFIPGADEHSKV